MNHATRLPALQTSMFTSTKNSVYIVLYTMSCLCCTKQKCIYTNTLLCDVILVILWQLALYNNIVTVVAIYINN